MEQRILEIKNRLGKDWWMAGIGIILVLISLVALVILLMPVGEPRTVVRQERETAVVEPTLEVVEIPLMKEESAAEMPVGIEAQLSTQSRVMVQHKQVLNIFSWLAIAALIRTVFFLVEAQTRMDNFDWMILLVPGWVFLSVFIPAMRGSSAAVAFGTMTLTLIVALAWSAVAKATGRKGLDFSHVSAGAVLVALVPVFVGSLGVVGVILGIKTGLLLPIPATVILTLRGQIQYTALGLTVYGLLILALALDLREVLRSSGGTGALLALVVVILSLWAYNSWVDTPVAIGGMSRTVAMLVVLLGATLVTTAAGAAVAVSKMGGTRSSAAMGWFSSLFQALNVPWDIVLMVVDILILRILGW